jgi:catechol 2,3-dioxygenase-like lactoylglutathione lyase family enzyme
MTAVSGIHHVKLPVTDVAVSRAWYERVLGFVLDIEFEEDGVVRGVGLGRDGVGLALREAPERAKAMSGFDALALRVPTREQLHEWQARLDGAGEPHGGIVTGHRGGAVLVGLHDPDGIEIRLYAD